MRVSRDTRWTRITAVLLPLVLVAALFPVSSLASAVTSRSSQRQADTKADHASKAAAQTDRVLVRWSTRLSSSAARASGRLAALAARTGRQPTFVRVSGSGAAIYDLGAPLGQDAGTILAAIGEAEGVASVEPDVWMTTDTLPGDPRASELWGLLGTSDGSPYGIDAPGAWPKSTGAGVVVAVIDTGLVAHDDLAGQAIAGYDLIWDDTVSNDGNGRDPDASDPGDFCGSQKSSWHGTHVAGTIAALTGNGVGVFGGAAGVKIQPVRVLGTCGGRLSDVADGVRWAGGGTIFDAEVPRNATPARVLNLSLGTRDPMPCADEMQSAISDARSRGAVVVVAAGNASSEASQYSPANCDGVITVGATDQAGKRASFSNYGEAVELAGPGVSILSTVDSGPSTPSAPSYAAYSGTSMATPHVVVAAALVAASAPTLTPAQIETILAQTATPFGADSSTTGCPAFGCGSGIVHAARPISVDSIAPAGSVSINGDADLTSSLAVNVAVPASDAWGVSHVRLSNDPGMAGAVDRTYATPQSWTLAAAVDGARTVYVQWRDAFGNWSEVSSDSITVDATRPAASAPRASVATGAAVGRTTVPVTLAWSGSDAGSGLARFEVAQSTNGGAWTALALSSPTATTLTRPLLPGSASYRFRVRAIDAAGNESPWMAGPTIRVQRIQESAPAIRYAGIWSRVSAAAALGGRYRATTRARASATYVFTGRSIAWIASLGPTSGWARVYIDGVLRGRVHLRSPAAKWRQVVFSQTFPTAGRHTILIVGSGTRGHPRVSLDAFVVLR